ncbi:beta-galactosidase [Asticcacaulis sp. W401b]|uniref:beta-galactosidase n=1 Tax=Asticcacaulis sp. W401b TaxID=3388666 RepID=UPI0039710F84
MMSIHHSPRRGPTFKALLLAFASVAVSTSTFAATLDVDATVQPPAIRSEHLKTGTATDGKGHSFGINNLYLVKDGKPWLPVMGEFHYTRFPPQYWEEQILKMKASGLDAIATYVVWNHHEERAGEFNFKGDRNLRQFLQLAQKHDMKVVLRIGPWAHGEVRFGGTPDWVVNAMPTRRNDPTYLKYVDRYWTKLAAEVKGQFFKDGGPIIAIQLENEYNLFGPGRGAEHISALKEIARKHGFDVPYYTVTGWDGAIYPRGEVVPVFAGYADEPWGLTADMLPPKEVYSFRFDNRVAGDVGAQTRAATAGTAVEDMKDTPFLGAEYGGGVPIMYRRRPYMRPDDIGAMLPVQLGSGANLYGYYMYHGGRNPEGYTTLEENALLGAYNDMQIVNYDFQAPFGQYGDTHPVLNTIRPYHMFLHSFGERLAPMVVHRPAKEPASQGDLQTPRFSVRSKGEGGFIFFNNYVRQHDMAEQKDVRFNVKLPSGTLSFPSEAVTVPTGAHFIWPFNFDIDGTNLAWATAQPLTRLQTSTETKFVFIAEKGIVPELAFDGDLNGLDAPGGTVKKVGSRTIITGIKPGLVNALSFSNAKGKISVVVLSEEDAKNATLLDFAGAKRLIISSDFAFTNGSKLTVRSKNDNKFRLAVYPPLAAAPKSTLSLTQSKEGLFQVFEAQAVAKTPTVTLTKVRDAQEVPPLKIGGLANAALQPAPELFGRSAAWEVSVDPKALDGVSDAFLEIDYQGDVARLFSDVKLLDDDFWYGPTWRIGLKRFKAEAQKPLTLTILPFRSDAQVYIDDEFRSKLPKGQEQVAEVKSIKVVPEYELTLDTAPVAPAKKRKK